VIVAGVYSFNGGKEAIEQRYPDELAEVYASIKAVDSSLYKTKISKEKTMPGKMLYHPATMNRAFKQEFGRQGWRSYKVACDYTSDFYVAGYSARRALKNAFREIDFVKNRLGVEVQFGKYAFMVYNVCAKMTIFHNLDVIDMGIEIVPVKEPADEMSTGVSYFEQSVWDLKMRGVSNIDIPVLILGVAV
jgi:hypothetical protein